MKKIITLLLAMTMFLSLALCVNAAEVTTGINVRWEDGDIVTVTVSAVGLESISGGWISFTYPADLTLVNLDKATETTDSTALTDYVELINDKLPKYDVKSNKNKIASNRFGVDLGTSVAANYIDATSETELFKVYFVKSDSADVTAADTFKVYYSGMGGKTYYINNGSKTYLNVAGAIGFTYVPSDDPIPTPTNKPLEEDFSTSDKDSDYESETIAKDTIVTYGKDSNGNPYSEKMGESGKVHTFFAKTPTALKALEYGVTATIEVDGTPTVYKFPGKADVEANQAWAIKIVIPNGAFMGGKTAVLTSMDKY